MSDANKVPQPGAIDCSFLFPPGIGRTPGLHVFRIDAMSPDPVPKEEYGRFCVADCYIILKVARQSSSPSRKSPTSYSSEEDESDSNNEGKWMRMIWTWVGSESEMDKRFCVAMFAVGLKNWIGSSGKIVREAESEETPDFISLFGDLEYVDASLGTESGLYIMEEYTYPLRVYKVETIQLGSTPTSTTPQPEADDGLSSPMSSMDSLHKREEQNTRHHRAVIRLTGVEPSPRSLKSHEIIIIDNGLEVFQWNGDDVKALDKAKARMLAQYICKSDRMGRATLVEMDEGREVDRLWDIITPEEESSSSNDDQNEDEELESTSHLYTTPTLYKVLQPSESATDLPYLSDEEEGPFDLVILGRGAEPGVGDGNLRKAMLEADGCYILDTGVEMYLWVGKDASKDKKAAAAEKMALLIRSQSRPPWMYLHRAFQSVEPLSFKLHFSQWPLDATASPRNLSRTVQKPIGVDVRALYADGYYADISEDTITKSLTGTLHLPALANSSNYLTPKSPIRLFSPHSAGQTNSTSDLEGGAKQLVSVTAFVFGKGGGFARAVEAEDGHLCSGEAYIFLCVYKEAENGNHYSDSPTEEETDESYGGIDPIRVEAASFNSTRPSVSLHRQLSSQSQTEESHSPRRPKYTCRIYFWQGPRSSKVAHTTFRFRAQPELEHLVRDTYGCPVRVMRVDPGREPRELAVDVWGGGVVVYAGKRHGLKESVEGSTGREVTVMDLRQSAANEGEGQDYESEGSLDSFDSNDMDSFKDENGNLLVPKPMLQKPSTLVVVTKTSRTGMFSESAHATSSSPAHLAITPKSPNYTVQKSILFHLRTDPVTKVVRAIQVPPRSENLVSRDCFFTLPLEFELQIGQQSTTKPRGFLWVGRNATREEVRKAHEVIYKILEMYDPEALQQSSPNPAPTNRGQLERRYRIVSEGLEPKVFWQHFEDARSSPTASYALGPPPPPFVDLATRRNPMLKSPSESPLLPALPQPVDRYLPRFLTCSCSKGYFVVSEIPSPYIQRDLRTDTCAILDTGLLNHHKYEDTMGSECGPKGSNDVNSNVGCFVWFGKHASDVLKKLTRQAVRVWISENEAESSKSQIFGQSKDKKVVFVEEGKEVKEFCALFHGWDSEFLANSWSKLDEEPMNQFSREQKALKEQQRLARLAKNN
ncbi:hypothetical protein HDV05_006809 [Chytridiales sp. JEL 0842]|nr:hypothetical protein HDV05_006809 [Chytridiales sp. JEL 0842]